MGCGDCLCGDGVIRPRKLKSGATYTRHDGMVDEKRFVVAEIAVGEAIHKTIAERVQARGCALLRNAGTAAAAASRCERLHRDIDGAGELGVGGKGPVDMELPLVE